ncbi:glycosyl hydrolase [Nitrogeniibacter mangrovi]|uniref:Glycosyl hydrolase n=1 Tax=Nitrogeniibacter mangrovi TaxID=2016596 RepID=A0A6C1B0H3_9RHOO|nr:YCF48-related protein [Nitrogeniibacter mangrovi]QID16395.1 glycosyl hydrolase [Nitrogeniibacter mangrovi]
MASASISINRIARSFASAVLSAVPLAIIGSLLYAAFFIKWEPQIAVLKTPPIERRDLFYGVVSPSASVVWAVGSYGKIVRSDDGGASWAVQSDPLTAHLQSIAAWDAQRAVAVGNGGVVIVTGDGGKTWTPVKAPRSEVANKLMRVRAYPGGFAWAVGEYGAVLRSTDFGATWTRVIPAKDQAWNDIFFLGQDGWLVGEFGQMLRTGDGGATWTEMPSPVDSSLMSVAFRDPLDGVAVGLSGVVLVTADGGASWTQAPPMTREHLNSVIWDGAHWIAVGDKGMRVVGDADGAHWTGGRISEQDLAWRTQILKVGKRYFLAGANLSVLDGGRLLTFGRD